MALAEPGNSLLIFDAGPASLSIVEKDVCHSTFKIHHST
jgi:hypothetical protein